MKVKLAVVAVSVRESLDTGENGSVGKGQEVSEQASPVSEISWLNWRSGRSYQMAFRGEC